MKQRRIYPPTQEQLTARSRAQTRQELRRFASFLATQDPEALAADGGPSTLADIAQVDLWFRRYVQALTPERVL
jgi:hypothetical protein